MKKEYIKPTLSITEYEISADIANVVSMGTTQVGDVVDAGSIWENV